MAHWGNYKERYIADATNLRAVRHVHDLMNEKASCTVNFIEWSNHAKPFATKEAALAEGFVPCIFCMPAEKGAS